MLQARFRVRNYFTKSKKLIRRRSHTALIDRCLSEQLMADVRSFISKDVFQQVLAPHDRHVIPRGWYCAACTCD